MQISATEYVKYFEITIQSNLNFTKMNYRTNVNDGHRRDVLTRHLSEVERKDLNLMSENEYV